MRILRRQFLGKRVATSMTRPVQDNTQTERCPKQQAAQHMGNSKRRKGQRDKNDDHFLNLHGFHIDLHILSTVASRARAFKRDCERIHLVCNSCVHRKCM